MFCDLLADLVAVLSIFILFGGAGGGWFYLYKLYQDRLKDKENEK